MRVTYPTSRTRPVITLGRAERALWQATTADGRDIDETRRTVQRRCDELLASDVRIAQIEVYAPAEGGGHMVMVREQEVSS